MLTVCIPPIELWDETKNEFVGTKGATIQLEHSLVAISKWESRWNVPFLTKDKKTPEQLLDYIKYMTITQNVPQDVFNTIGRFRLTKETCYLKMARMEPRQYLSPTRQHLYSNPFLRPRCIRICIEGSTSAQA